MPSTYKIKSNSVGNLHYNVSDLGNGGWGCDCPAGALGKVCIHIRKAQHVKQYGSEMTVNENLIRVVRGKKGEAAVDATPLLGEDVNLLLRGTVVGIEENDNFDGTYDRVALVKPLVFEEYKPNE